MRNMRQIPSIRFRLRRFVGDRSALAAVEFALILPLMLMLFFGTVEFSSGVAVDRKVTLVARTLSDLTSQSISVANSDLTNFFSAAVGIMTPYDPSPTKAQISEIYIDSTKTAKIQWTMAATITSGASQATLAASSRSAGDNLTSLIPSALLIPQTSLIFSEVSYKYVPTVGYVMAKAGINLSDVAYTRPRQSSCVIYPTPAAGTAMPACPST